MMVRNFKNRVDAGRQLTAKVKKNLSDELHENVVVVALPRGGVVVGAEIAKALDAPLGIVTPRKIGHPQYKEVAIASVSGDGIIVWHRPLLNGVDELWFIREIQKARQEAKRRNAIYLGKKQPTPCTAKTVIIVDDGMATGLTMLAAVAEVSRQGPLRIIVAIPVAHREAVKLIKEHADSVVTVRTPRQLEAISDFYNEFGQVLDEKVIAILKQFR
jgi:predicted phosphoribosyltransferase